MKHIYVMSINIRYYRGNIWEQINNLLIYITMITRYNWFTFIFSCWRQIDFR